MVKEFNIDDWTTDGDKKQLDFIIPTPSEKPIVQVYKYMLPNNDQGAVSVDLIDKLVVTKSVETLIILTSDDYFRGYVVIK